MSMHQQFKMILLKKFQDMKFLERLDNIENFWIQSCDVVKIIESKEIPQSLSCGYVKNGVKYYSADNLLYFLRLSVNPHHTLDYQIPMGFSYTERPLLDVVRLFDKYGIRGKYNYNMEECSNCLNFKVSYYYHCPIPLLVDVYSENQDAMRENLYKMFESQRCRCIEIDTRDWEKMKDTMLFHVESHLLKLNAISFMEKIIKESEEIKDVVDELGNDVIGAICSNVEFPFQLSECLKKFRITETNPKYDEIMALFETFTSDASNEDEPQLETIDENDELDMFSDESVGNNSDMESCDSIMLEEECMITTQQNGNTMYIMGQDYVICDGNYYLNHPTLIKIAIRSGIRRAEQYVDKTWKLVQYINRYGRQAYNSLLKTMDLTTDERKQMFTITNTTFEQNHMDELSKAQQKIKELESHIDINKTKKAIEKYRKVQIALCAKDNIESVETSPSREVFVVEKQPTKVKTSSIVKKTKDPIKSDELETFLGL